MERPRWRRETDVRDREPPVAEGEQGWKEVQRELDRSRRHQRAFVLIRIPSAPDGLGETLRGFVRSVDSLWVSNGDVYVLLPESTRAMGEGLLGRVRAAGPLLLPEAVRLVAFPEDAVTGGALRALLDGRDVARYSVTLVPDSERALKTS
jgi:hypothetical protein